MPENGRGFHKNGVLTKNKTNKTGDQNALILEGLNPPNNHLSYPS